MKKWAGSVLGLLFASATVATHAQWLNYKTPGVPRTADGKPNLTAPAPRSLDGHPDLSGVWMHELTPVPELRRLFGDFIDGEIKNELPGMEGRNFHKYGLNVLADFADDTSPARPETKRIFAERLSNPPPEDLCDNTGLPFGFPGPGLVSEPIKLVQAPHVTMVIYEVGNNYRQIYTDGRTLPAEINLPSYFGYSVGRWDRDTLVVDTAGFNDKVPLDFCGPSTQRAVAHHGAVPASRLWPPRHGDDL